MQRLLLLALLAASPSWAAPKDDARAAYATGEYGAELRIIRPLAAQGEAWARYLLALESDEAQYVVKDDDEVVKQ